jgi:hypothetical protein
LQKKHPAHPTPTSFPVYTGPHNSPFFQEDEIVKSILSFPPGSASGIDGLKPQILKDLLSFGGDEGVCLRQVLTDFLNLIGSGYVPDSIRPIFFGAALTALRKKDGGIRPIAVGLTWRRLVAKILVKRITPDLASKFSPHQLGVGVRGGCEAGAHSARIYYNSNHNEGKVLFKIDFRNAFNEVRRDVLLQIVTKEFPSILPFVDQSYRYPSKLFFGKDLIDSDRGVQQGDPLGPALFALAIHPIVQDIESEFNCWYLDDGTIGDHPEKVERDLATILRRSAEIGLTPNFSKCEIAIIGRFTEENKKSEIFGKFNILTPGLQMMSDLNATLLGSPLADAGIESSLEDKIKKLKLFGDRLTWISSQSAYFLLRQSFAIPRLIYLLRSAPTWKNPTQLHSFDIILKSILESVLNINLTYHSWAQSSLPIKSGGIGIKNATDLSLPCFLSSFYNVEPLIISLVPESCEAEIKIAEILWMTQFQLTEIPAEEVRKIQNSWETPIFQAKSQNLLANMISLTDQARLKSCESPESGAWLQALPSTSLGTHLSDETFRISCSIRLGCGICVPHHCHCGAAVDESGLHGLCCKKSAGRRSRHESINDVIARALRSAEIPCIREPTGCFRADGKRPDGMSLIPWKKGKSLIWDFTCRDSYAPSYINNTACQVGFAANLAEEEKIKKYKATPDHFIFIPVAIESSGVWGNLGFDFVRELGRRLSFITKEKKSTSYLFQRISLCLQRGNTAAVLGTLPAGKQLDEIFNL